MTSTGAPAPDLDRVIGQVFGDRTESARRYVGLLGDEGVQWGLIGPREHDRLWERHILNSVGVAQAVLPSVRLIDVGSGAGLPGIPVALARPDLHVTLLEPLARRVEFLTLVVTELGLAGQVEVVRGRADDPGLGTFDVVTARAVAPLDRLLTWCLPLMGQHGTLVALKGQRAEQEVLDARSALRKARATARVQDCTIDGWDEHPRLVVVDRGQPSTPGRQEVTG